MIAFIQVAWLAVSAVLFVLWIWHMFSALFALARAARRATEGRGGIWPNLRDQWAEFRRFATDATYRGMRWRLCALTLGLLSVNLAGFAIWATGPP